MEVKPSMKKEIKIEIEMEPFDSESGKKEYEDWEVECALRSIIDAEKAKADPELMKKVAEKAGVMKKAIKTLDDLAAAKKQVTKKDAMAEE